MVEANADEGTVTRHTPQDPRPTLDEVDRVLAETLRRDGRATNATLAKAAGIAESTCTARLRRLQTLGVVTGVHAVVDHVALGRPVEALVSVRFSGQRRRDFERLRAELPMLPGVLQLFHVSGANDYLVHVAARSTSELRDFVLDHLTGRPDVAHAETSLVFDHVRGQAPL
ncbi:Lrp/AsnC family transcriptional regulator [Gephyromycinifex aptenodytis]|uniref:Lrp/AsnC family transcriptional regulator n=1 Tax=Gephyromycinifex aptenodytis TaxID=2716227 RepID=UPI0014482C28|nr:Lrp/AsnC family transcriptional regulator [Gephyromycinifex aptenodytis]